MRRPNMCNNSIGVADETYKPNGTSTKDEGRLSLVRRVLGGSRKKDGNSSKVKQFGTPLSELQLNNNSIPKTLHRICVFIEINGMKIEGLFKLSGGNSGMIENLKTQFNTEGDAELEAADVNSVALLLVIWLKELPQPLLPKETVSDLITLMHKYDGDAWWGPMCHECILTSGSLSSNVMDTVLHLLHSYTVKHPSALSYIPNVFCPLLTCEELKDISSMDAIKLTTKFIQDYNCIFRNRNIDGDIKNKHIAIVLSDNRSSLKLKKKKDKLEFVGWNRQFVRSNSEERPAVNSCDSAEDSMRRVSSHEDFSKPRRNHKDVQLKKMAQPLHERNSCSPQRLESLHVSTAVGYTSELYDENEHERRRNSERFAPQHGGRRNGGRRRRKHVHISSKENKVDSYEPSDSSESKLNVDKVTGQTPALSELVLKEEKSDDEGNDKSSSPISGVGSPTLDLNTFGQMSDSEPVPSIPWSTIPSEERLASPRSSLVMTRRTFTHESLDDDPSVLALATQINNLKRKLKKYNEGFEREFGYKPSHADKMANPDTKRMCNILNKLKKQLKTTKEECAKLTSCEKKTLKEEVIEEIEKRLSEKRAISGRSPVLEVLTHEQLIEEKAAMQKALLQLEASFGRPTTKEERDMVRGLYDRYRAVKRLLLRLAPSKLKENINELGTILEHETMDFSTSPPPPSPPRARSPDASTLNYDRTGSELLLDNLHSLPQTDLLALQRSTRDEKKKLRRHLKEFEIDFENRTGRRFTKDDRDEALQPTYSNYKQVKAKLRFIDALVKKMK